MTFYNSGTPASSCRKIDSGARAENHHVSFICVEFTGPRDKCASDNLRNTQDREKKKKNDKKNLLFF